MFLHRLKLAVWGAGPEIQHKVEESKKKVNNFFDRTRLGGLLKYRKIDFKEVVRINELYASELQGDSEEKALFALDWDEKKPVAGAREISRAFRFDRKNDGDLAGEMELISDILVYTAQLRLKEQSETYTNGAAILFYAEWAEWANGVAKRAISEDILEDMEARLRYLSLIQEEGLFAHEPNDETSVYLLVHNLTQIIEYAVIPKIKVTLSQWSVRDYLKTLHKHSEKSLQTLTRGLFYLFTEEEGFVHNVFHFQYLHLTQIPALQTVLQDTELGQLFNDLSEHWQQVSTGQSLLMGSDHGNRFLTDEGKADPELMVRLGSKQSVTRTQPLGIHPLLLNTFAPTKLLITTLGCLSDTIEFMSTLQQAYRLSGDGGNILMYLKLGTQMNNFLACFHELHARLKVNVNQLLELSDTVFQELIQQHKFDHPWKRNYCRSKRLLKEGLEALVKASGVISHIGEQMRAVNSENYLQDVQERMEHFSFSLTALSERLGLVLPESATVETLEYSIGVILSESSDDDSDTEQRLLTDEPTEDTLSHIPLHGDEQAEGRNRSPSSRSNAQFFTDTGNKRQSKKNKRPKRTQSPNSSRPYHQAASSTSMSE